MFLNFIDQYGLFFGILIGVIIGIVIAYLLFSRPKKTLVHDIPNKKMQMKETNSKHPDKPNKIIVAKVAEKPIIEESSITPSDSIAANPDIETNEEKIITNEISTEEIEIETVKAINLSGETNIIEKKVEIPVVDEQPQIVKTNKVIKVSNQKKKTIKAPAKVKKDLGRYHVLFRKEDSQWYVKREGSERVVKVLQTQKEAIAFATIKSITQKTSIVIHKRDGKIRKQIY